MEMSLYNMESDKPVYNRIKLEEVNKALAFFMGAKIIETYNIQDKNKNSLYDHVLLDFCSTKTEKSTDEDKWHKNSRYWASTSLTYHKDWNELMRVVQKIDRIKSSEREVNVLQEFYRKYNKEWCQFNTTKEELHLAIYLYIVNKKL